MERSPTVEYARPICKSNIQDMATDAIVSISASGIKNILSSTKDFVT